MSSPQFCKLCGGEGKIASIECPVCDGSGWDPLTRCCDKDFGGSHYHCPNCGEACGMMGHWSEIQKRYYCRKKERCSS